MHRFNKQDSLFILTEKEVHLIEQLNNFELFYFMLRPHFVDHPVPHWMVTDLTIFYYAEELPVINQEVRMQHLLQDFILRDVVAQPLTERIKARTKNNVVLSILAAVHSVNVYIDNFQPILTQYSFEERRFFARFSQDVAKLFEISEQHEKQYPERYVKMEAELIRRLREQLREHALENEQRCLELLKLLDSYDLEYKRMFSVFR